MFKDRLEEKLFLYLKSLSLKDWGPQIVLNFANAVVKGNQIAIDQYLTEKNVTLKNVNKAIDEIVKKVLIPSIKIE